MSIRNKLLIPTSLLMLAVFAALVLVIVNTTTAALTIAAQDNARSMAAEASEEIAAYLSSAGTTASTVGGALRGLVEAGTPDRALGDAIMRSVLEGNPQLQSVFTEWDVDAFDGRDVAYAGTLGADVTGRYFTWFYRDGGGIALADYGDQDLSSEEFLGDVRAAGGVMLTDRKSVV